MEQAIKDYIKSLNTNKKYSECIKECQMLFDDVDTEDLYFLHMEMAKSYRHLEQYKKSIEQTHYASMYNNTPREYILCLWQFGNIYFYLGYIARAFKFYLKCYDYFVQENDFWRAGDMQKNMSKIGNNVPLAYKAIDTFRQVMLVNPEVTQAVLDDAYDNLHFIYCRLGKISDAYQALTHIQNEDLRTKLMSKLAANSNLEAVNI